MARLITLKQNLTYNSKRAAIAAVQEVYRTNADISYLIVNDDAGRFYPVLMPRQLGVEVKEMSEEFYWRVWQRYLIAKA